MKSIDEDIKTGQFQNIYLLYGEEAYLKRQYKEKLLKAMVTEGDTMNFSAYEGKDIVQGELIDLAETLPFFAERRVLLVEDSGFFKNSSEELAAYIPEVAESTCFIFVESEVDKRNKLYKQVKKSGRIVCFERQNDEILMRWVGGRLKKEGKAYTLPSESGGFINDIDDGLPFWPDGQTDDYLYMIRAVSDMRDNLIRTGSPKQQALLKYLDSPATHEKDYVMIIAKLKK